MWFSVNNLSRYMWHTGTRVNSHTSGAVVGATRCTHCPALAPKRILPHSLQGKRMRVRGRVAWDRWGRCVCGRGSLTPTPTPLTMCIGQSPDHTTFFWRKTSTDFFWNTKRGFRPFSPNLVNQKVSKITDVSKKKH